MADFRMTTEMQRGFVEAERARENQARARTQLFGTPRQLLDLAEKNSRVAAILDDWKRRHCNLETALITCVVDLVAQVERLEKGPRRPIYGESPLLGSVQRPLTVGDVERAAEMAESAWEHKPAPQQARLSEGSADGRCPPRHCKCENCTLAHPAGDHGLYRNEGTGELISCRHLLALTPEEQSRYSPIPAVPSPAKKDFSLFRDVIIKAPGPIEFDTRKLEAAEDVKSPPALDIDRFTEAAPPKMMPPDGYRRCEVTSEDGKIKFYECLLHESHGLDIGHVLCRFTPPFKVTVIGRGGTTIHHYKEDGSIVSESDHEVVTGREAPCADCYRGLNGQLELCEKHRLQ